MMGEMDAADNLDPNELMGLVEKWTNESKAIEQLLETRGPR
jgi:hypothetical protein